MDYYPPFNKKLSLLPFTDEEKRAGVTENGEWWVLKW
jgi:hypothetical protein